MRLEKYSSYIRLISITALVLGFIENLKRKNNKDTLNLKPFATTGERIKAENLWIRFTQNDIIKSDNYKQLQKDLNLYFDEENIRCQGRLKNTPLNYSAKFPVLMSSGNYFTNLVINFYYILVLYNGMKKTFNQICTKFWISKSRNQVKPIIKKCLVLQRHEGKAFSYLPPPDLPSIRLIKDFPFTYTGVDYAGPLYVKDVYSLFIHLCLNEEFVFRFGT